jgi:hypothetical protein
MKSSAEEGNRTLPSSLKTIGRSGIRTPASGQEAPHDALTGQRYWPDIGPAPPSATRVRAGLGQFRGHSRDLQTSCPKTGRRMRVPAARKPSKAARVTVGAIHELA